MKDNKLALVTGANGHLGNNLVRELLKEGYEVTASVRDLNNTKPFEGLDCKRVYADFLNKKSLINAFEGIEVVFHVAAVFKHWSKNPEKEIIEANLQGAKNVMEAASICGVKKIIYVSSIAALDFTQKVIDEKSWGRNFPNHYFKAKNDSEKLAWELADKYSLDLITVLPSGMIGPEIFGSYTPAMNLLNNIIHNKLPFDPQYEINYVHVQDVAIGIVAAERYGKVGERYILGNESSVNTSDVLKIANRLYPETKIPRKASKNVQLFLAKSMKIASKITGNPPMLLKGNINHYYKRKENLNTEKARRELGFRPMNPEAALAETFEYLLKVNVK